MATAVPAPTSLSRKFFVFFDFANNNPKGVAKAKEAALHFLDTNILPGDEVGLRSYSTVKGLSIHEYLTADARKVREAVDALSAKGLSGRADDVEQTFGSRFSRDIFSQGGVQQNSNLIFKDESVTGLASLTKLAVTTGGKYFGNINEYGRNMDLLQDLTGSYYFLGYAIGEEWDGAFHAIRVEVGRKGCEVRAQAGYFNPKPFAEYSAIEKQLHLFDLALSDKPLLQTPLAFALGALSYASGEEPRLLLLAKIPNAVLEKFAGRKVEIVAVIFDDRVSRPIVDRGGDPPAVDRPEQDRDRNERAALPRDLSRRNSRGEIPPLPPRRGRGFKIVGLRPDGPDSDEGPGGLSRPVLSPAEHPPLLCLAPGPFRIDFFALLASY